jgi:hypothetical protein
LTYPFGSSTYPSIHTPKTSIISCLLITYTLSLCLKHIFVPLIKNVFRNSNITLGISVSHPIINEGISFALEAQSSSLTISFQFSIHFTCLSWFCFVYVHMNRLGFGILIPFSRNVALSRIVCLLFTIASASCYSIFIAFCCAFAIVCTFAPCYTFNSNSCSSFVIIFSFDMSFYIVCASTKCYSSVSSSFNSSIHTRSINVALGPICSFAH